MVKETTHDGWDCVPKLKEVADALSYNNQALYEIRNCVRQTSLDDIVNELRANLEVAMFLLDEINTEEEFKTI